MKTLQNITDGFNTCKVQSLQLSDCKLCFNNFDTNYMIIERYVGGYAATKKIYTDSSKFIAAINRYINKQ
jgi:hypothetical protein